MKLIYVAGPYRAATEWQLVQNIRRGHYELAVDVSPVLRLMTAFTELARAI